MTDYREVKTVEREQGREHRVRTYKATQLIWLLLGLLEILLAFRFVFKLIGVNPANAFATLLYTVSGFFLKPFETLTSAPAAGGMVLEISTLIAMLVYLVIAWALERIVYVLFYRPRGPISVEQTVISDHTVPLPPAEINQSTTTQRTTTQTPTGVDQTTVTEKTNTRTPGSL